MKRRILLLLIVALAATSCTVQRSVTAKRMDIYGSGVIQHPVIAEMEVNPTKITGTASSKSGTPIETVKNSAVADALKKANADVLIEPIFSTVVTKTRIEATVTGFPATYKNFRSVTENDIDLLELGIIQKAAVYETVESKQGLPKLFKK